MKVADFVINYLADKGIKEMFVVYGSANGDLVDAFTRTNKTKYVTVMHEQAGGFMAEGYARVSGKFGVAIATSGPGGQNFVTAVANCFYDSIPCLFITGQISTKYLRPSEEIRQVGFQESDMVGIMKPITKYSVMVTKPEDVKYELQKAIYLMCDGRPGPVHLDLPLDIQKAEIFENELIGYKTLDYYKDTIEDLVEPVLSKLQLAKRPIILIGGAFKCSNFAHIVIRLLFDISSLTKIPIIPTWNALDIVTNDFEYYGGGVGTYGGKGRNFAIQNCDFLLAVGSRISGRITGGNPKSFARGAIKYLVNVDDAALQPKLQQLPFDYCIKADASQFLDEMLSQIVIEPNGVFDYSEWWKTVRSWRDKYDPVRPEYFEPSDIVNPYAFVRLLSKILPSNAIVVSDCGGNVVIMNQAFETKAGQIFFSSNGNSPMGFSFAGAIGAWFASDKKQPIVCVIGDGGMNMNIQELQTIKTHGVNIKVFIMNNYLYGITAAFQRTNFNGRLEACGPDTGYNPPDFIAIAKAYGLATEEIGCQKELSYKISRVMNTEDTVICNVNCKNWSTYEPRVIGWDTPIEDMYPYLSREEFLSNMIIEPYLNYLNPKMPDVIQTKES